MSRLHNLRGWLVDGNVVVVEEP